MFQVQDLFSLHTTNMSSQNFQRWTARQQRGSTAMNLHTHPSSANFTTQPLHNKVSNAEYYFSTKSLIDFIFFELPLLYLYFSFMLLHHVFHYYAHCLKNITDNKAKTTGQFLQHSTSKAN